MSRARTSHDVHKGFSACRSPEIWRLQVVRKMISLLSSKSWNGEMADLLVRGIDEELVRVLKERAGAHGRSAEAEHREILAAALARPR